MRRREIVLVACLLLTWGSMALALDSPRGVRLQHGGWFPEVIARYGCTPDHVKDVASMNGLSDDSELPAGYMLFIPTDCRVQKADAKIAAPPAVVTPPVVPLHPVAPVRSNEESPHARMWYGGVEVAIVASLVWFLVMLSVVLRRRKSTAIAPPEIKKKRFEVWYYFERVSDATYKCPICQANVLREDIDNHLDHHPETRMMIVESPRS